MGTMNSRGRNAFLPRLTWFVQIVTVRPHSELMVLDLLLGITNSCMKEGQLEQLKDVHFAAARGRSRKLQQTRCACLVESLYSALILLLVEQPLQARLAHLGVDT